MDHKKPENHYSIPFPTGRNKTDTENDPRRNSTPLITLTSHMMMIRPDLPTDGSHAHSLYLRPQMLPSSLLSKFSFLVF
ncbi:hypothetical protein LguiA_021041 [Lonicera macranthoides]